MHVEKRKEGKGVKYYLSHSYREGGKVHKFRKYLGQDLASEKLEERKLIAEKLILEEIHKYTMIRDPLNIELSLEEIEAIKSIERKLPIRVDHLSEADWATFSEIFTYHTNAIEGSKLSQREVRDILEEDKWPDKSKEDIAETFGVDEAVSYIRTVKEHISLDLVKKLHKIVFKNSKQFAGRLRKKGEEVVVMDGSGVVVHEGAPQSRVLHLLNELIEWYGANKSKYPGLLLAAVVHDQFETIHPFRDGNGRVGRLLLNNILLKHNLPPLNINLNNRQEYYASLQAYQHRHDLKPTIDLFIKEYAHLRESIRNVQKRKKKKE